MLKHAAGFTGLTGVWTLVFLGGVYSPATFFWIMVVASLLLAFAASRERAEQRAPRRIYCGRVPLGCLVIVALAAAAASGCATYRYDPRPAVVYEPPQAETPKAPEVRCAATNPLPECLPEYLRKTLGGTTVYLAGFSNDTLEIMEDWVRSAGGGVIRTSAAQYVLYAVFEDQPIQNSGFLARFAESLDQSLIVNGRAGNFGLSSEEVLIVSLRLDGVRPDGNYQLVYRGRGQVVYGGLQGYPNRATAFRHAAVLALINLH